MRDTSVFAPWATVRAFFQRLRPEEGRRKSNVWSWFIFILGMIYFFLPLYATFVFSLKMIKDRYTFEAYKVAFQDPNFFSHFGYSVLWAILTIVISLLLICPQLTGCTGAHRACARWWNLSP